MLKTKVFPNVVPLSPASSMAKVIAASTPSATSVPVPDETVVEPSLDFGDGNDFGDGWGSDNGNGAGAGGGGVSFFKQKVKAQRIAYVIDYSLSMEKKGKFELMKKELAKSVKDLPDDIDYQLIFFAGPAWLASDEVVIADRRVRKLIRKRKTYNPGKAPAPKWITSDTKAREESLKHIERNEMSLGTTWTTPLELAMDMKPLPDIIFFMTDGTAGQSTEEDAKKLALAAKKKGVIINCVALMEPRARDAMAHLARETGGAFTMVNEKGRAKKQNLKATSNK